MGKFKVGDRVRVKADYGTCLLQAGGEYEILRYAKEGEPVVAVNDLGGARHELDYSDDHFELVEQPWQPKVGDRVRVTYSGWEGEGEVYALSPVNLYATMMTGKEKGNRGGFVIGSEVEPLPVAAEAQPAAWVPAVGDKVVWLEPFKSNFYTRGKTYEIVDKNDYGMLFLNDDRGDVRHSWSVESIVKGFKLFAIQAGKFYRTRDGRKVGPMEQFYDDGKCFESKGAMKGGLWHADGSAWFNGADDSPTLIAEWVDEPAAAPAVAVAATASNDNAPKSTAGFTIPPVDEEPSVAKDGSTQLTVRITSDFTELHEQIDYAFERLKKLKKKARKLGIDLDFAKAA
ncbi:hypothetical protein GOB40_13700 [Sinorhizobium meliloti]|nr:hypothetical protein [Sinorhizobium meliloti]